MYKGAFFTKHFFISCCLVIILFAMLLLTSCSIIKSKTSYSSMSESKTASSSKVESQTTSSSLVVSQTTSSITVNEIFTVGENINHNKLFNKDNSVDFTFCGVTFNIPNSKLSDFISNGADAEDFELVQNIKPKTYDLSTREIGDTTINLEVANLSNQIIIPSSGNICELDFLPAWISDSKNYILPQGITIGSSIQDVRAVYGAPEFINIGTKADGPNYIAYEYHQGNTVVTLLFDRDKYTLFNLSIDATPTGYSVADN